MLDPSQFDPEALEWFARRGNPTRVLDNVWRTPDWHGGRSALEALFKLDSEDHFLRHHRGLLPQLWERQITKSLRALLSEDPARTLECCQALLTALEGTYAIRIGTVDRITADGTDRMDLAVHCRDADDVPHCMVIEAKLDSELSPTQLRKYRNALILSYPTPRQRHLWIVAPTRTTKTANLMQKRENEEWQFVTWRRLLLNWQAVLPAPTRNDALSLFGEIWKRVGGR